MEYTTRACLYAISCFPTNASLTRAFFFHVTARQIASTLPYGLANFLAMWCARVQYYDGDFEEWTAVATVMT